MDGKASIVIFEFRYKFPSLGNQFYVVHVLGGSLCKELNFFTPMRSAFSCFEFYGRNFRKIQPSWQPDFKLLDKEVSEIFKYKSIESGEHPWDGKNYELWYGGFQTIADIGISEAQDLLNQDIVILDSPNTYEPFMCRKCAPMTMNQIR